MWTWFRGIHKCRYKFRFKENHFSFGLLLGTSHIVYGYVVVFCAITYCSLYHITSYQAVKRCIYWWVRYLQHAVFILMKWKISNSNLLILLRLLFTFLANLIFNTKAKKLCCALKINLSQCHAHAGKSNRLNCYSLNSVSWITLNEKKMLKEKLNS